MRKIITLTLILLGFAVLASQAQKVEIKSVTFEVNMHCQSCKAKIERDIVFEKGVKEVEATLDKKLVTIKYDATKTDPDKIAKAIEKLGYTA
ncbi:MAG: heavy-metal-associated domain-containing protein, partial [Bacteroidales bacterium]|nr:heavy-metal-associated domain-containing protein [Bacteroidales bacterium]